MLKAIRRSYDRHKRIIECLIYPLALLVLPLLNYNCGVDVSDSTYSLGNYMFADRLNGMWVVSTYLSNKIGAIILKLPGADSLRFSNIYTGLILSTIALIVYFFLKDEFDGRYVFLAEFAAVCFCWIPTGILYNYLSYLFMVVGALLLYRGIVRDNLKYLISAGVVLGLNIFVRIPNITQTAFIAVLWVYCIIYKKNALKSTLSCICGYLIGAAAGLLMVIIEYGLNGLIDAVLGLKSITETDSTYTPLSMITGTLHDYIRSAKWIFIIVAVCVFGMVMFSLSDRLCAKSLLKKPDGFLNKRTVRIICILIYLAIITVMIRFFWGRGMFSFRYYEDYTSMYEWGMVALYMSIVADICILINACKNNEVSDRKKYSDNQKSVTLAMISLVVIFIAPLGSNNHTYQNLNNLFLVLPCTFISCFGFINSHYGKEKYLPDKNKETSRRILGDGPDLLPVSLMLFILLTVIMIQSFGFHYSFVFRDGMRGEPRDYYIDAPKSLKGMYTNRENAEEITKVLKLIEKEKPDELILYGNCPGFVYLTGIPSAMSSSWSDLDSNSLSLIEEDLKVIKDNINKSDSYHLMAIVREEEPISDAYIQKKDKILGFLKDEGFTTVLTDGVFTVYEK